MSSGRSKLDPKRPFVQGDAWPQVSIVVRCRNEKSALPRLFSCIRMQQYPGDIELILVDSGSTDGTRELSIPSFARWLDIAPEEFTWGRALNLGCSAAKGEILVLLSAHTFPLERTWLRALIQPFREAGVALVHGRQVGDARINSRETAQLAEEYPPQDIRGAQKFSNANGALPMALYRENPFDEDFQIGEEIPLVRFAIDAGFVVHYSAEAAVEHAHAADAAGEYRRWFWKGYVFEKHIYRGKKRNSLPVFTLRYLYSLGKSSLLMLRTGAWREIAALPRLEWLKGLAFRRGIQAARREEERGPDFSQVRYGELELPPSIVRAKPRRTGHPLPRSDATYTRGGEPGAEQRVEQDLQRILHELEQRDEIIGAWIAGSFGRGEGTVFRIGDRWQPQNDYDFELLVEGNIPESRYAPLGEALARELGMDWVDFHAHNRRSLRRVVRTTQYGHDLVHGSRLILDRSLDGGLHELLVRWRHKAPELGFVEAEKIFFARIWALLAASHEELAPAFRLRQLAKCCFALVDARLMGSGLYVTSYHAKRERWRTLVVEDIERELTEWAFSHKLGTSAKPDDAVMLRPGSIRGVAEFYFESFLSLASVRYGRELRTAADYASCFRGFGRRDPVGRAATWLRRGQRGQRNAKVFAQLELLERWTPQDPAWQAARDMALAELALPPSAFARPGDTGDSDAARASHEVATP